MKLKLSDTLTLVHWFNRSFPINAKLGYQNVTLITTYGPVFISFWPETEDKYTISCKFVGDQTLSGSAEKFQKLNDNKKCQ